MDTVASVSRREFLEGAGAALLAGPPPRRAPDAGVAYPTVEERLRRAAENAPLALTFKGSTAAQCRKWQAEFGRKLRSLLGPHAPPPKWKTRTHGVVKLSDHVREELLLEAEGHPPLPVYLLVPRGGKKRRPGVLALHGHGAHGHHPVAGRDDLPGVAAAIKGANYDYGRQLAKRGYVVAVPCLTPFGVRLGKREAFGKQDPCSDVFRRMQILGKLLIA